MQTCCNSYRVAILTKNTPKYYRNHFQTRPLKKKSSAIKKENENVKMKSKPQTNIMRSTN